MNKNFLISMGVLLAIIVAGFYFIGRGVDTLKTADKKATATVQPEGPVKEFDVSASEYGFSPATIVVNTGDTVKINFTNNGTTLHDFVIEDLNLSTKAIGPGKSDSITFTAGDSGISAFYCSISGHRGLGMQGTLEVK
jgi:nitrite reductase (NO-forming)